MSRTSTVYFDTSFYVMLCRAEESVAFQTISDLNSLDIRHVISDVILRELLTSKNRNDLDQELVERLRHFRIPPYQTTVDLAWEVLLLAGQDRIELAERLRDLHDQMAKATSVSIMARREMSSEQASKLSESGKSVLKQFGFPDDLGQNSAQTLGASKAMLDAFGISGLEWPENPGPEDFVNLSNQLFDLLGPAMVAQLREQEKVQDSVTRTEDRPFQVAINAASPKVAKGLSNTLRDTEHMMIFLNRADQIDLLHIDRAQEEIIKRETPKHHIVELGLGGRCFSANSLPVVVEKVRSLVVEPR
jgi:hypothetical protein